MNGPRQRANPKLFEAVRPSLSAKVAPEGLNRGTPLRSVLGFSEQGCRWVKKLIGTSEKGFCKDLALSCLICPCPIMDVAKLGIDRHGKV